MRANGKTEIIPKSTVETDSFSYSDFYHAALKRRWLMLLIFLGVVFLAIIYTIRQPRIFEAACTVQIDLRSDQIMSEFREVHQLGDLSYWQTQSYLETQYKIIQSDKVAQLVVERLHLDRDLTFLGLDKIEDEAELAEQLEKVNPVRALKQSIIVDPITDSRLVRIIYQGKDPKMITTISNTIAEVYLEQNLERKMSSTRNAINWLREQMGDLKKKLEESERELYEFKKENNILSTGMDEKVNIIGTRLIELSKDASREKAEYLRQKARYESLMSAIPVEGLEDIAAVSFFRDSLIKDLKITYTNLRNKHIELLEKYREKHPDVMLVKSKLDMARENLHREINNIIAGVKSEYQASEKSMLSLIAELEKAKSKAQDLTLKEVEFNRLMREKESNQHLFEQVLGRLKEIDLSSMLKVNNLSILDKAKVPNNPVKPRVMMNILVGAFLGLILASAAAFVLEAADNTLKSADDIERHLGVAMLGIVPSVKIRQGTEDNMKSSFIADRYSYFKPKSSMAECMRTIRTNISFISPEKPVRKLLVTSASPKEGKTTICSNLGITMAQSGKKVLLVDSDMRRPRLHKVFDLKNEYGLSNIIMGSMTEEDTIRTTGIENLDILSCGPVPPNPAELVGSNKFKEIVNRLSEMYDLVVFDSPPVIAVADAMIISSLVDGVIHVVECGKTIRDVAFQAEKQLNDVNANVLGVIINNLDLDNREYGHYYYYYYHRYGYYYGDKEKTSEAASS